MILLRAGCRSLNPLGIGEDFEQKAVHLDNIKSGLNPLGIGEDFEPSTNLLIKCLMGLNPLGIGEDFELHLFLFINKNNQLKTYFDKQNSTKKLVIF